MLVVNGVAHDPALGPERTLLSFLREHLGLTAAKPGCGEGVCGACTVLVAGRPVRSCTATLGEVGEGRVTTLEGLAPSDELHPLQQAFLELNALQCGYCTPGMIMSAAALLAADPDPEEAAIVAALDGNVCRCCAYPRIVRAVCRAAQVRGQAPVVPPSPEPALRRPPRPWDLVRPSERDWFAVLPDGLVAAVEPTTEEGRWSTSAGAWLHVGIDGSVTAFTGKVDVGQGNRTALSLLVAGELEVPVDKVRLVMGDTDLCPYDEGTFGSRSLADAGPLLRAAAAVARRSLDRRPLEAGERRVELGADDVPGSMPARGLPRSPRQGGLAIVTGALRFPSDLSRSGMVHGAALRPPGPGARLRSLDDDAARAIEGVTVVHDGELVGVAAADPETAKQALQAVEVEWELPPGPDERELADYLRSHPIEVEGWAGRSPRRRATWSGPSSRPRSGSRPRTPRRISHMCRWRRVRRWRSGKAGV